MFPKKGEDAWRIEGDNIILPMFNVINPIPCTDVPDKLTDYFEFVGDDDQPLAGKDNVEASKNMKVMWNGEEYNIGNYKKIKGKTMPIGDKVEWIIPNTYGWKAGESHKFTVRIHSDNPVSFNITRTLN